jgi:dipeptidyl aminopeptidase/acylaminoacyl peptidase
MAGISLFSNIPYTNSSGTFVGFRPAISAPDGTHFHLLALPERPIDLYCSAWTPNDRRIICGDNTGLLSMRASDGGRVVRLTHNPFHGQDLPVGYAPNGRRMAFIRSNQGDPTDDSDDTVALLLSRPDGTHIRRITPYGLLLAHELSGADWSPDGRHLASTTVDGRLAIIAVNGKKVSLVPLQIKGDYFAALPTYSPNGRKLAFSLFKGAPSDLYRANLDGSRVRQITRTEPNELFADWRSPYR